MNKPKILIVERDPEIAKALKQQLERLGYEPVELATQGDGAAVMVVAGHSRPDLALLDIDLTKTNDGLAIAQAIRSHFSVPIVFLAASATEENALRNALHEPFDCIVKPFSARELRSALEFAHYKHKTEAKLLEAKERLRLTRLGSMDGVFDRDLIKNEVYYSPRWLATLGYTAAELQITPTLWQNLTHPDDVAHAIGLLAQTYASDAISYELEIRLRHKDGHYVPVLTRGVVIRDATGRAIRVVGATTDLSVRKLMEQELRAQRDFATQIIDTVSQGLTVTDAEGHFEFVNPAYARLIGVEPSDIIGKSSDDFTAPEDRAARIQQREARRAGKTTTYESRLRHADGSVVQVLITGAPRRKDGGEEHYVGSIAVVADLTARKQVELERENERKVLELVASGGPFREVLTHILLSYETLLPGMRGSVLLLDQTGRHLSHGAAPNLPIAFCKAIDGVEIGPCVGSCGTAAYTGKTTVVADIAHDPLWCNFKDLAQTHGLQACWSVPIMGASGKVLGTFAFYFHASRSALPSELATIERGAQLTSLVIGRHLAETALRENEGRYRTLFHWTPQPFFVHRHATLINVNPAAVKMFGATSAKHLIGKPLLDLVHPDFHQIVLARTKSIGDSGTDTSIREMKFLKLDGTAIDVEVQGTMIVYEDAPAIHVAVRDTTERKLAETTLMESEQRYRALVECSPEPTAVHRKGAFVYVNPAGVKLFGALALEDLVGKRILDLIHPDSHQLVLSQVADLTARGVDAPFAEVLGVRFLKIDGAVVDVEVQNRLIVYDGGLAIQTVGHDITSRKQAELARASLEAQLRESQKMEAIGTLAGGIAHDFNNILATILGNTELARQDAGNTPQALESLNEIRKAGTRARDLVQQILSFSRRQPTERKQVALGPIIEESVRLLRATLQARITLKVHCDDDVPPVLADATQIQQVVINLSTNAMQAMHGGPGRIGIRLDTVMLNATLAATHPSLLAMHERHQGRTVRLAVSDNGRGMSAATVERIFEPFFTTKAVDEGTGLGLSVVHGIVQGHEGAMVVESEPDKGSTFTFYLPVADLVVAGGVVATPPVATGVAVTDGQAGAHILYLDDDESLVFLVQRLLERRGYRISGYVDQREALAALRARPASFDLVVTDYNMPGLSGLDVAREVRAIRADLPVAVASGFIDETLRAQAGGAGVRELIFKANAVEDLCEAFVRLVQTTQRSVAT